MADISSNSKVAYMYDQASNTWYAIAGVANTNVPYTWTQVHTFGSTVTVNDVIKAKGGVNRFQNPTVRDSIITSPQKGTVCFVEQTDGGTDINQVQIYNGTSWVGMLDTTVFNNQTSNYTLVLGDAGKTILIDSTSDRTVTIPSNASVPFAIGQKLDIIRMNTGNVTINGTPEILSKDSSKEIASRYSRVTLIKKDTDTWILVGDLSEPVIPPFFPPFFPPTFTAPFFPPTFTPSPFFPPTFGPFFAPAPFFPPTFTPTPFFPPTFTPTPFFPPFFPPTFTSLQTYYFCCDDNTVGTVSAANSTDATNAAETFCFNISAALTGVVTTTPITSCTQPPSFPFFPPTFTPTPFFPPFFPPTFTSLQTYYFCCDDNTVGTTSAANSTDATNNAEAFCFSISAALTGVVTTSVITSCTQPPSFPFFPPTFTPSPFFPPTFTPSPFFPPTFTSPFFPPTFTPTPYFPPPYFTPAWGGGGSPFFPPTFTAPSPFFPPTFTAPAPYFPPPYFTPRWGSDYRLKNDIEEYQVENSTRLISEIEVNDS